MSWIEKLLPPRGKPSRRIVDQMPILAPALLQSTWVSAAMLNYIRTAATA